MFKLKITYLPCSLLAFICLALKQCNYWFYVCIKSEIHMAGSPFSLQWYDCLTCIVNKFITWQVPGQVFQGDIIYPSIYNSILISILKYINSPHACWYYLTFISLYSIAKKFRLYILCMLTLAVKKLAWDLWGLSGWNCIADFP